MRAAIHLCASDLRQRLRDRSAILVGLVVPLALAFIFGLVFGSGATPRPFAYAVVDLDGGTVARAFRSDVLDDLARSKLLTVRSVDGVAEAERMAADGVIDAAFVLPAGLTEASVRGSAARIDVIGNGNTPTGAEVARSIAGAFATELTSVRLAAAAATGPGAPSDRLAAAVARASAVAAPLTLADVSAKRKILDVKTYFAAGMAVFFLFFTVQFGVSSLVEERTDGTLRRLLAAPIRPLSILAGKLLTSISLGVLSLTVLAVATGTLMGARWGDPVAVAVLIVCAVLAATGVTGAVASFTRSPATAGSAQAVVSTLLGLLGGAFFPLAQAGGVLGHLSLVTPHAWFLRGLGELAAGGDVGSVLPAAGAMLAFGLVTGAVAVARLGRSVLT